MYTLVFAYFGSAHSQTRRFANDPIRPMAVGGDCSEAVIALNESTPSAPWKLSLRWRRSPGFAAPTCSEGGKAADGAAAYIAVADGRSIGDDCERISRGGLPPGGMGVRIGVLGPVVQWLTGSNCGVSCNEGG